MNSDLTSKIQRLQKILPPHGVVTSQWLQVHGIYQQLAQRYVEEGWIERIGYGAFKRQGETITWEAALSAVQTQLIVPLHVGGLSALEIKGSAHYQKQSKDKCFLFGYSKSKSTPKWFDEQKLEREFVVIKSTLFPEEYQKGISEEEISGFNIKVSSKERAVFELLYQAPKYLTWEMVDLVFENLVTLRPNQLQMHLELCSSVKVKRLFLFLAEKYNRQWFQKLNLDKVDLGSGERALQKGGRFDKKYKLVLPEEFF